MTNTDDDHSWPKGLTQEDGKLYSKARYLVRESRWLELCEAWHHHMVHPRVSKQAPDMLRRFAFNDIGMWKALRAVRKGCAVCQVCNPRKPAAAGEPQCTPVPERAMESVALDVFSMPEVHISPEEFKCVVLCVDDHNGYILPSGVLEGFGHQGSGSHDGSPLADRLWYPLGNLQQLRTVGQERLVQSHVLPDGHLASEVRCLLQTIQWSG